MTAYEGTERIGDAELLARFILFRDWIRADGTVKADAFVPPSDLQLSVTRHLRLHDAELWRRGLSVE